MRQVKKNAVKCRSVFNPGIARRLLKLGNPIYDIKPKKEMPEASIFLFEETEKFQTDLSDILYKQSAESE